MKPRTLLILAVLVAALGSFIWFWERRQPSTSERAESQKKLVALEVDDVSAIGIAIEGRTVRLEREAAPATDAGGGATTVAVPELATQPSWRITAPIQAVADRWAVERLVESFNGLEKQRTLEDPDRSGLGLEAPRAVVTFERKPGKGDPVVVEVGAKLPAAAAMSVAVRGEKTAAIVPDAIYNDLAKPAGDWRSREMFTAQREAIDRVQLSATGGTPLLLARRGESFWLEAPLADRADRDLVNTLLSDLVALRAAEFFDAPPPVPFEAGLSIEAVLKGQESPFRLEIGAPTQADANRRYARVGAQIFATESKLADTVSRPAVEWRSPAWSASEVFRVDSVRLEGPMTKTTEPVLLARAEGDWKRGGVTVAFTTVSDLLYAITGAKSKTLLGKAEAEKRGAQLAVPALTTTLGAADGTSEVLMLYPALPTGEMPAMASGRDVVLLLDPATGQEIATKLTAVQAAEPEPPPSSAGRTST